MIAGAAAGMGEHMVMFPIDTIKTRMQALAHPGQQVGAPMDTSLDDDLGTETTYLLQLHSSLRRALQAVLHREGFRGLYNGVSAVALGAGYVVGCWIVWLNPSVLLHIFRLCSPSHALYFASYEAAKNFYGGNASGHQPIATAAAGEC